MIKPLALLATVLITAGCTNEHQTREVLSAQGFTDIEVKGYDWFGCSSDDTFATAFTARSPTGAQVQGVVCSDWFKGATVRFH